SRSPFRMQRWARRLISIAFSKPSLPPGTGRSRTGAAPSGMESVLHRLAAALGGRPQRFAQPLQIPLNVVFIGVRGEGLQVDLDVEEGALRGRRGQQAGYPGIAGSMEVTEPCAALGQPEDLEAALRRLERY